MRQFFAGQVHPNQQRLDLSAGRAVTGILEAVNDSGS
jgi:hypothetical protein